jgi:hypothetical protein
MNTLDSFEENLLIELRTVVTKRRETPTNRRRSAVRVGSIGAVAAAAVGGIMLSNGATPAFAVTGDSAGDVTVQVTELEDAAGLQQALAEHGVIADVSYRGADLSGDSPAARQAAFDPATMPNGTHHYTMSDCTSAAVPALQRDADGFRVTIPKATVDIGENLTILVAGSDLSNADLLVAVGNHDSGCATFSADDQSGIGSVSSSFSW